MTPLPYAYRIVGGIAETLEPVAIYTESAGVIAMPRGTRSDGATIPRGLRWLLGEPFAEPRVYAAIVHDWLYATASVPRAEADAIYRETLIDLGVPKWRAWVEWSAVRVFGANHYGKA